MYILGLGGSNHDFSACLVKDGMVKCMIEDERITRKKNGVGLGIQLSMGYSSAYCLNSERIGIDDVDLIVANNILVPTMYKRMRKEVKLINHHLSHAATSYYLSEMQEAAILVVDAVGSKNPLNKKYESSSLFIGEGKEIHLREKNEGGVLTGTDYVENSLGIFYSIITQIIGFGEHQEGKTMGLASYGSDRFYHEVKRYIDYKGDLNVRISKAQIKGLLEMENIVRDAKDGEEQFMLKADLAWAAQTILEEIIIGMCRDIRKKTKLNSLCLSGGIALNSVVNYKIHKENIFKHIFVPPACGDNGTSIGSALYGYYSLNN